MRFSNFWLSCALVISFSACKTGSNSNLNDLASPPLAGLPNGSTLAVRTGDNVLPMTVNGSTCAPNSYPNKPCVSLTICDTGTGPGSGKCTTVNDILVDTGSYGLRIFKSTLTDRVLTPVNSHQGGALAECAKFGDGTSLWGAVRKASLIMGSEPAIDVPIQVIDSSFGAIPASCGTPDASVAEAGFNGILGVGLFSEDCGVGCTGSRTSNGMYFTCTGGNTGSGSGAATCIGGSTSTVTDQVQNPVAWLPKDNNGVVVELPSIPASGQSSVEGYLILGVGTQANNTPAGVSLYPASVQYADFVTKFNGKNYSSFLDTGSNGLYFSQPADLPTCSSSSAWYCPSTIQNYSAVTIGEKGGNSGTINFQIANTVGLFNSGNHAFNDLGGSGGNMFDWGLPFYFGRNVYLGIDGKSSSLGTGPYWAY